VVDIIEIINDEVDAERAAVISNRIRNLIGANTTANEVVDSVIVQPEIMPARELSPKLKQLLEDQGGEV
jgi:hypothetical protein